MERVLSSNFRSFRKVFRSFRKVFRSFRNNFYASETDLETCLRGLPGRLFAGFSSRGLD
jgi:hypothetical protein